MYQIRKKVAEISVYLYQQGLAPGKSGNISLRKDDVVAITPTNVSLRDIDGEAVALVNLEGEILSEGIVPSSELQLHLMIYREREGVEGVVHIHSPYATGFALAGKKIKILEGFGPVQEEYLEMVGYAPPGSEILAQMVKNGLKKEDALILEGHGLVAVGPSLEEAALLSEWVEKTAKTIFISKMLQK
ncbi:MAG: class II aldolase/adducin family protein [Methanobacteriaceae archaeon]|nr:class II aldolase/adducin family protein [Methanobacteriaceae archaeon]